MTNTIQLISSEFYEVFEIHTAPRGLYILTLRINKENVNQFTQVGTSTRSIRVPIDSLTTVLSKIETKPQYANFIFTKNIGNGKIRRYTTKSFTFIHNRVNAIKDALNNPNLQLFIDGNEIPPYVKGVNYVGKGIYQGIYKDDNGIYHYFSRNKLEHKQYIND